MFNPKKLEIMDTNKRLDVNVKARRVPKFKAGSDLSSSVNIMNVDVDHEIEDNYELIDLKLSLISKSEAVDPDLDDDANQ